MKRILITGAGGPLGVNVTRSLRRAPEILFLLGTECNRYHIPLSLTDKTEPVAHASNEEKYIEEIKDLVKKYKINLILPTHPGELRMLGKNRRDFKNLLFLPEQKAIELGNNKFESSKIWQEKGLPVPKTIGIENEKDIKKAFETLASKVWVRGSGTPGQGIGGRALLCDNVEHAKFWIDYWKGWGSFSCSEYLPGDNMTWLSLWKDGELITSQGRIRLEYVLPHVSQSGITGAPAVSKTVSDDKLNELGKRTVEAIDSKPNGIYFADYKKDASGQLRITEINVGRFGTTIHFYTEAGLNFPYIYLKLGSGEKIEKIPQYNPLKKNIYWLRTLDCGPIMIEEGELP